MTTSLATGSYCPIESLQFTARSIVRWGSVLRTIRRNVTADSIGEGAIENIQVDSWRWKLSSTDRKVTSVGEWGVSI